MLNLIMVIINIRLMRVDYMMNLFTLMFYITELQYLQAKSRKISTNTLSFIERLVVQTTIPYIYKELPFGRCISFER